MELEGKWRSRERGVGARSGAAGCFAFGVEGLAVGVAAFFPPSEFLRRYGEEVRLAEPGAPPEVGAVYVRPEWQARGVGLAVARCVLEELGKRGTVRFCLDAGLPPAPDDWRHRLGPPDHVLADFWGPGAGHGIWISKVARALARTPPRDTGPDFA